MRICQVRARAAQITTTSAGNRRSFFTCNRGRPSSSRTVGSLVASAERTSAPPASIGAVPLGRAIGTRVAFYARVELENAIEAEMTTLVAAADAASREIAANRPWWVAAVAFLRKVVL